MKHIASLLAMGMIFTSAVLGATAQEQTSQERFEEGQRAVTDVFPQAGRELIDASEVEALPSYSDRPDQLLYRGDETAMTDAGAAALTEDTGVGVAYNRAISPTRYDEAEARALLATGLAVEADPLAVVGDQGLSGQYGDCVDQTVYGEGRTRYGCEVASAVITQAETCTYGGAITGGAAGTYASYVLDGAACDGFYARRTCSGFAEICTAGPEVSNPSLGFGQPDYAAYVDVYPDLLDAFTRGTWSPGNGRSKAQWGALHWAWHGSGERRYLPRGGDCWSVDVTATCEHAGPLTNTCAPPSPACTLASTSCLSNGPDGTCLAEHYEYDCPGGQTEAGKVSICGENVFCITGDCFPAIEPEPSDQFAPAAAAFAAVFEGTEQFDRGSLTIFDGENLRCGKAVLGAFNCCKNEGVLNDLGLNRCNAEEVRLASGQDRHECSYVGTYCSDRTFFGVCLKKQRSYCCYGSRLARIISEQGRAQLGLTYGRPQSPDCSGFTVNDFARLNIGAMDLSEFYGDLEAGLDMPDPAAAMVAMQTRLDSYGQ